MSQIIDIYFRKLCDPVDILNIKPASCRSLQRAGITTVADVLLAGRSQLRSVRSVGRYTVREVWWAAASYLGLSEDQLLAAASALEREGTAAKESPIDVLQLPLLTFQALQSIGIGRIDGLIQSRIHGYSKYLDLGSMDIAGIDHVLCLHMARLALAQLLPWMGSMGDPGSSPPDRPTLPDSVLLQLPGIHEQTWPLLEQWTMHSLTLEKAGLQAGDIRHDRASRLIREAQEKMHRNLGSLSIFLDHFEKQSNILQKSLGNDPLDLKMLVSHLLPNPIGSNLIVEEREMVRMILLIRSLMLSNRRWFWHEMEPRWRTFILMSCLVAPDLKKKGKFQRMFREPKPKKIRKPYPRRGDSVLSQSAEPVYRFDLAEQIDQTPEY